MKKGLTRIFAVLLALVLAMTVSLTALADSTPLIYRVSDSEGHEIYMLGTIHVGDESMYPIRGIDQVLDKCDVVAFELSETEMPLADEEEEDIDLWSLVSELLSCVQLGGSKLDDDTLDRMSQIEGLEGISALAYFMKPSALAGTVEVTLMENAGVTSEQGVEMYLMQLARDRGLQIVGLETAEEQDAALASGGDALYLYEVKCVVEDPEGYVEAIRQMLKAWAEGDR